MYSNEIRDQLSEELQTLKEDHLYKKEYVIVGSQGVQLDIVGRDGLLNFCANNYLGLSSHPRVVEAAKKSISEYGYGLSSVRFICGTQTVHKNLERRIADFLGMDDAILYAAAFDANGGLFDPLLNQEDVILSDRLNHASIIDGVRLSKAHRLLYDHNDMEDLQRKLEETSSFRRRLIVTDGVFSMDGTIAQLDVICDLARKYNALVFSDESHATGFVGKKGRGVHELCGVVGEVDIISGTLGKALGGASGGFIASRQEIIDLLRQRSRPYLFSNSLPPAVVGASIEVLDLLEQTTHLREKLNSNTAYFRKRIVECGFEIIDGNHPIVPIMLYEARITREFEKRLIENNILAVGFYYPVVPKGKARIRVQISASHERVELDRALQVFTEIGRELGVIA